MADKKNLLLLFENPGEPIFTPKGKNKTVFQVPDTFLEEKYQNIGSDIQTRFGDEAEETIQVQDEGIPDLKIPSELDKQENFSLFIPSHRKLANALSDIFLKARDIDQLQSYAVYARDRVNAQLYNYALSVAILHRPDTKNMNLPLFVESFPSKFLDSRSFGRAREEANVVQPGSRRPIVIPREYTASDLEPEHRLWYFREDLGINLHHWHWHLVYPYESSDINIVRKDRRGELFYYMHQQVMARYNFERQCNDLPRTSPLIDLRAPIPEGYFPKMDSLIASRSWPARQANSTLKDLNRTLDQVILTVADLEIWRERFLEVIQQNSYIDSKGQRHELDEKTGIDVLGNMMEATILSPNYEFYGDFHNLGHVVISYQHDPDHRHLESFAVMGDASTAMRDPVFYRWHQAIDDIFNQYKSKLTPYTTQDLSFSGIRVKSLQVQLDSSRKNQFHTFWQQSDVNLAKGLDFVPRGDIFARFTHLQHMPYNIMITVNNDSGVPKKGLIRVFMAPKTDDRNRQLPFNDQRRNFIELDKFFGQLNPGETFIRRRSLLSTVTVPYESTFRNLDNRPIGGENESNFNFCGCGWPHHMLIPKGTPQGIKAELFVMVTSYDQDYVHQGLENVCDDATAYCGLRDRLYPDKRSMGFPFDRNARPGVDTLDSFMTPNMLKQEVLIIHNDQVVGPKSQ